MKVQPERKLRGPSPTKKRPTNKPELKKMKKVEPEVKKRPPNRPADAAKPEVKKVVPKVKKVEKKVEPKKIGVEPKKVEPKVGVKVTPPVKKIKVRQILKPKIVPKKVAPNVKVKKIEVQKKKDAATSKNVKAKVVSKVVKETPKVLKSDKKKPVTKPEIKEEVESDEQPLVNRMTKIKSEPESDTEDKPRGLVKKRLIKTQRKLLNFWNGPKRHRVASLNAIAKVHCLYENESRGAFLELIKPKRVEKPDPVAKESIETEPVSPPTRKLRSAPGMRGVGKHWEMSSSSERSSSPESYTPKKAPVKRQRHPEIVMDLKDMVVRKRMASLNATAILAASYSPEKDDTTTDESSDEENSDCSVGKRGVKVKKKVSVIVNQDTDVTITGVFSTTRSTHLHEGYFAGMQYRISATSHTQTNATAVATETLLHSSPNGDQNQSTPVVDQQPTSTTPLQPSKSYTPLSALSNMQPPGAPTVTPANVQPPAPSSPLSPVGANRVRHSCSSAFSAPPYGPPHPHHPHLHPPKVEHPPPHGYIHGK